MTDFFILQFKDTAYYKTYFCLSESNKVYIVISNINNLSSKDIIYYLNDFIYNKSNGYYGYGLNYIWIRLDHVYG